MSITVSATEARNNLFNLLNRALYKGETIFVTKAGADSMVKIESIPATRTTLAKLAGSISDKDATTIKSSIAKARNYPSRKIKSV